MDSDRIQNFHLPLTLVATKSDSYEKSLHFYTHLYWM